jgi:inorganic phosphate transporter, PiT family
MLTFTFIIVILTIAIALVFDFINGFHDAANSIATVVSTGVLKPSSAVMMAAVCNFLAMLIFVPKVAETISKIVKIEPHDPIYVYVILAGLLGAIVWDLLTWWLGLPTSSSHALIGGFAGAGIANGGLEALHWEPLLLTMEFIIVAPVMGMILGFMLMLGAIWIVYPFRPAAVNGFFRNGQLISASLYSLGHGGNDAQKTMGIILALLIASGHLPANTTLSLFDYHTLWIIFSCHAAIALGTATGGWRIVRTMGMKITKLRPMSGFCAEAAGAITLFLSTMGGIPVSTTHTITGAIIGVGSATNRYSNVRWGVAGNIIWSWTFTIPAAGIMAAVCFWFFNLLGISVKSP